MQNSAARLVTASRKHDHITPILRRLHWPPVRYRIIFKTLLLTYKALNGQAPSYIKDLLKYRNSGRVLRSSNKHFLDEPVAKLKTYGDRAYSLLLQNCEIGYHWTLGYHRQLLYLKLSLRHICLRIFFDFLQSWYCKAPRTVSGVWRYINAFYFISYF